ncbi:MAG: ferredoxin [Pseudomonadota bacterium]
MDRWSNRVITGLARAWGGQAFFPFGGPPYHPFYTWALKTGRAFASPIGFLVHDSHGLMVSFRGAIFVAGARHTPPAAPSPCLSCAGQPCRTACPVGAFADGYNLDACHSYLDQDAGRSTCMAQGCAARRACPIGQDLRAPEHSAFHMAQFHKAST